VLAALAAPFTSSPALLPGDALVVLQIRLPRILVAGTVGAALGLSGALMQGLFRNPLADPGLVGVSAGAALGAGLAIVFGERTLPFAGVPAAAFAGGLVTTFVLARIATRHGRTSVAGLLLAGVACGALANAILGLLSYLSDDRQLRDLTFWMLGSFGGAGWSKVFALLPFLLPAFAALLFLARGLNALTLGEAEAFHLGVNVQRLKGLCILCVALSVGASVAVSGVIGFVGIVVPHAVRLMAGADHRVVLPSSALLGASLLILADMAARTIIAPAELPVGVLTATFGAPFFLWILLRRSAGGVS
jgi:iron complex transport system permease protein